MKITVKVALLFALLWIIVKMSMYFSGVIDSQIPGTLVNILFLLLSISVGLFLVKSRQKEPSNALGDIKDGISAGLPYTLIVSVFLYFFYGSIDRDFSSHKISERLMTTEKMLADEKTWETFKRQNEDYETYTKEQFLSEEKVKIETANSPKAIFVMSLLGGLMLGVFYSILVAVIYRKIVFR